MKITRKKRRPLLTLPRATHDAPAMRSIPELVQEIRLRQSQIERAKEQIIAIAPVQTGDTVEINEGGSLGKQMLVATVSVEEDPAGHLIFAAVGAALTIDGKPGSRRGIHKFRLDGWKQDNVTVA